MPDNLYEEVVEIEERVVVHRPDCQMTSTRGWKAETTSNNDKVLISRELDMERTKTDLVKLLQKGIKSLAVVFLHSYM